MKTHICPYWFSFSLNNRFRRLIHDPEIILKYLIFPGNIVVDIGCGPGYFSIPMALMVGENGKVYAVDVQEKMLRKLIENAKKYHLKNRIEPLVCDPDDLKLKIKADFILAFWMVHEVEDIPGLFRQIREALKPGGCFLLSEPKPHVNTKKYQEILKSAESAGLVKTEEEIIPLSRSMLFTL